MCLVGTVNTACLLSHLADLRLGRSANDSVTKLRLEPRTGDVSFELHAYACGHPFAHLTLGTFTTAVGRRCWGEIQQCTSLPALAAASYLRLSHLSWSDRGSLLRTRGLLRVLIPRRPTRQRRSPCRQMRCRPCRSMASCGRRRSSATPCTPAAVSRTPDPQVRRLAPTSRRAQTCSPTTSPRAI